MMPALRLILGCLLSASTLQIASAMEPGTYKGKGEYGETLTVSVKGSNAFIEVVTDGCQGDTEGKLKTVGEGHWQMRPDWPGCVIDFRQKGSRISVTEGSECFQLHGAMCTFNGTVTGKMRTSAATETSPSVTAEGSWTYGEDPVLGLSAHIRTPEGTVGLACIADGSNPATAEILALRITTDLIAPGGSIYMFEGKTDARGIERADGKPYGELRDTTCGVSLDAFRSAHALLLIEGKIGAINAGGSAMEMTIDQAGKQTIVSDGTDAAAKLSARSISLKGSSAAIKSLLRACPLAQMDVESNCGM